MTTDEMLKLADDAERLVGAASSGPWEYSPRLHGIPFQHHIWRKHGFAIAQMLMTSDLDEDFPEQASKNGPFIAASRTLVPQLASALRQAVARVRELERPKVKVVDTGVGTYVCTEGGSKYLHPDGQWLDICRHDGWFPSRAGAEATLAKYPPPPKETP